MYLMTASGTDGDVLVGDFDNRGQQLRVFLGGRDDLLCGKLQAAEEFQKSAYQEQEVEDAHA